MATRIFLPNPQGAESDYVEHFGLSPREFELIHDEMAPASRQFLLKQGTSSVVCTLDLSGFDDELTVMSGRAQTVELMRRLIEQFGQVADQWLPRFLALARKPQADEQTT